MDIWLKRMFKFNVLFFMIFFIVNDFLSIKNYLPENIKFINVISIIFWVIVGYINIFKIDKGKNFFIINMLTSILLLKDIWLSKVYGTKIVEIFYMIIFYFWIISEGEYYKKNRILLLFPVLSCMCIAILSIYKSFF